MQHCVCHRTDTAYFSDQTVRKVATTAPRVSDAHIIALVRRVHMSILAWIILGLIAGFVASKIVNRRGEGVIVDVLLGIGGAVVGGWLFHTFGARGVTGLNLNSFLVATIGAVVVLVVYHALSRSSGFRRI